MPHRLSLSLALLTMVGAAHAEPVDCLVSPHRVADLAFGSPGVVQAVDVDRGDHVRKGQKLASLDTAVEQSSLDIARAQADATAAIESAQAQLDLAEKRLQRAKLLLNGNNVAASRFEEIQSDYDVARLRLAELQEAQRLRALDVTRATAIMGLRTIVAGFDGVVVERHVSPGEYVENKRVLTISEIDPLFVDLLAPAVAFDAVRLGQTIEVTLGHPEGKRVMAQASVIDPFVDASSGTFRIRLSLPNPDLSIVAGFRCRAELPMRNDPAGK